jgi:NAD(P)-dependent dehydrogenase (short-subunit alcohol dehydrogenase family)
MMLHHFASEGAVVAKTRSMARELGEHGICCNALARGRGRGAAGRIAHGHSITSSTRTRIHSGIVRPSVLAICKFIKLKHRPGFSDRSPQLLRKRSCSMPAAAKT